jgi:hypothetical protein
MEPLIFYNFTGRSGISSVADCFMFHKNIVLQVNANCTAPAVPTHNIYITVYCWRALAANITSGASALLHSDEEAHHTTTTQP